MRDAGTPGLSENVSRTLGKDAQRNNILAAKLVADIVKTTLGPKGMDKLLVDSSGNTIVTNDGVTILQEMELDHPAAQMIVNIAQTQEREVGDGTTTAALLAGKLLENAEHLLDKKIHPTSIINGYRKASQKAIEILNLIAFPLHDQKILKDVAMTAMTGKSAEGSREHLADLIVQAAMQVAEKGNINKEDISIEKIAGESMEQSALIQGLVLQKEKAHTEMPNKITNAHILLLTMPLEVKMPERETTIAVSSQEQLEQLLAAEERYLKQVTDKIVESGANVLFCQRGIDDVAQYYLAQAGIMAFRRVSVNDMHKLARATSAKIISNVHDAKSNQLGKAALVEEKIQAGEKTLYISGCDNPRAVTLVVRGGTPHVLEELARALEDGLGDVTAVIKSGSVVAGGGAIEVELARQLRIFAHTLGGKEQLAVEQFAITLETIPETLAENAGLDPILILAELRKAHEQGLTTHGLNLFTDKVEDTFAAGIIEPTKVKTQAISAATEAANLILRIDDVLISKGTSRRENDNPLEGLD